VVTFGSYILPSTYLIPTNIIKAKFEKVAGDKYACKITREQCNAVVVVAKLCTLNFVFTLLLLLVGLYTYKL